MADKLREPRSAFLDHQYRYRAFICYSRADEALAGELHRKLEAFATPRALRGTAGRSGPVPDRLAPVFRDREELAASADIGERIREALTQSEFLIVVCSPKAAQSRWVNAEIEAFHALSPDHRERVLAVLADGEPGSPDPAQECFPPALRREGEARLLAQRHPLAADFRPGRDRRADAELRLIAAMLGVEFDALKQREQERRIGRLRLVLATTVAVMVVFAGLAVYALQQRAQARTSAAQAKEHADRALHARTEAEKLVEFMLKDLRPSLEVIGKLELLEPANEKVRAYYEAVATHPDDLDALRRQAQAFHNHAVDLRNRKQGSRILSALHAALALRQRITELAPSDVGAWQDLAETHRMFALQRRDEGDIEAALREIALARKHAAHGLSLSPDNVKSAARVATLAEVEGDILLRSGRASEARPILEMALSDLTQLLPREPANMELKNRAAAVAWQLGNIHRKAGDFAAAEAVYRRGLQWAEELCAKEPGNIFYLRRRELASGTFGQLLLEAGRYAEATTQLLITIDGSRAILALDPANLIYQDAVATNLVNLAEAQMNLGQDKEAEASLRESVELRERALKAGATDVRTRNVLAHTLGTWSTLLSRRAEHEAAIAMAKRGLELMRQLVSEKPADVRLADDQALLRSKLAGALLVAAMFGEAAKEYRQAISEIDAVLERDPKNPQLPRWRDRASWQLGLGSALLELGMPEEARSAITESLAEFKRLEKAGLAAPVFEADMKLAASLLVRLSSSR